MNIINISIDLNISINVDIKCNIDFNINIDEAERILSPDNVSPMQIDVV